MARPRDPNAWRRSLDPRDPESMDPLTEEEQQALERAEDEACELDAYFDNY